MYIICRSTRAASATRFPNYGDTFGHIHVADAPGRHEPGTGEINYTKVLAHLEKCGYTGRVGYELFPETDTATAVKAIMEHSPKA